MTLDMGTVKQVPSPNYTPEEIEHDLVIVHDMEGYYGPSVAYLCQPSVQASAHLCMNVDGSEWSQLVPLQFKAWAECAANGRGVSIEAPGFVAQGLPDVTLRGLAKGVAWLLHAFGIPCQHAPGGEGRGYCMHHDLGAAGGGHVDICGIGDATWQKFEGFVKEAYDALDPLNLPTWALHGAPGPHQIVAPPAVTPTPSHGGAPRNEPGDVHTHPTASTFPAGSLADIQHRLGVEADGLNGPETRGAIVAFQKAHGLTADGIVGPKTWSVLLKATT
jgi:peptidoglycan hydrolase-like protein with peptidoglycan-binding domain